MENIIHGNFVEILKKALAEMPEGKIEFFGPTDGSVSVIFIQGDIILVDSAWGAGNNELQRIYEWETGTCVIKEITLEERKILETTWQRPVIIEQVKKETEAAISSDHSAGVQTAIEDLHGEPFVLNAFLAEIEDEKYSGEARITTPEGRNQILFYQGVPLRASGRKNIVMQDIVELMNVPGARLTFYLLGDELTLASLSLLQGDRIWEGLAITVFHLDKMFDKLMEKAPTGHLCIHKGSGELHYVFFCRGKLLGAYDIEKQWNPVDISTIWEDAQHLDYYLSGEMESLLSTTMSKRVSDDLGKFISIWNDLIEGIAKKLGKKPVEKSLQRNFGGLDHYTLEEMRLQLAEEGKQGVHEALRAFKEKAPALLKEMETIVGRHWLAEQLHAFRERNGDLLERLSMVEVFSQKGG